MRRRRSLTVAISVGFHSILLVAAAAGAFSRPAPPPPPSQPPRVVITFGQPAPPRRAAPPPEAPRPPPRKPPPRPALALALVQPELQREVAPAPAPEPEVEGTDDAGADESAPASGPVGHPDGVVRAPTAPPPPVPAPPPPVMTADQRRQFLARYMSALESRIHSRFVYPPEAEREGVEGRVMVRVTIDCSGRLLSAATMGSCPSDILCEHAQRTIRDASPFPPPPRELGSTIQLDYPIAYRLN